MEGEFKTMTRKMGFQIGGVTLGVIVLILAFQFILSLTSSQTSNAQAADNVQLGTLVVSGVGEVNVKPDMAYVHLGAQASAPSAEEAQTQVKKQVNAIRKVLQEFGIKDEHIQTAYFNVYPLEQYSPDGSRGTVEEYRSEHVLKVEYKEIDRLGELIDATSKAGANRIEQIQFGLQNPEAAEHEALQIAIEKTAAKADVMAKSAGKVKGEVLQISDQAAQVQLPYVDTANMAAKAEASFDSTTIDSGEVKIVQRVDVVYRLK